MLILWLIIETVGHLLDVLKQQTCMRYTLEYINRVDIYFAPIITYCYMDGSYMSVSLVTFKAVVTVSSYHPYRAHAVLSGHCNYIHVTSHLIHEVT